MALISRPINYSSLTLFAIIASIWHQSVFAKVQKTAEFIDNNQAEHYSLVDVLTSAGDNVPVNQEVIVPLLIKGQHRGVVHATITASKRNSYIALQPLYEVITPFVNSTFLQQLAQQLETSKNISFQQLFDWGLSLTFDEEQVLLHVFIAPEIRKKQRYDLQTHQKNSNENETPTSSNASISAALDYFLSGSWIDYSRQNFNLELEGHINIKGWILQNRHSYLEGNANHWQRRQTLLTHDWPNKLTRLNLGDLNYRRLGFMGSQQISGLSFGTLFELQPQMVNYPLSEEDFFLEQDARVEVFIDGQLSNRRNLSAGQHNIFDLPLIDGVNEVELRITDILGRQQTLRFFETQDQRLLTPGLSDYSIAIGFPRMSTLKGIEYRESEPMLTAFYRHGLFDDFTLGSWLEIKKHFLGLGITGITNQVYGAFTGEIALSHSNDSTIEVAPALRLGYRYRTRHWAFDSEWSWQHSQFANLNQSADANNQQHQARIGITMPRWGKWTSNLSFVHSRLWHGKHKFSKRLNLTRQIAKDWRLTINVADFNGQTEQESFIGLQFYWNPSNSRNQVNGSFNSNNNAHNLEYNYRRMGELGLDIRTGIRDSNTEKQKRVDFNYIAPKFTSRVSISQETLSLGKTNNTQSFTLGSAFAFADGHWGTSRPIRGQPFALFYGMPSLARANIGLVKGAGLNPTSFLYGAEDTSIMPNLSAYYINQLNLDLENVPMEMQIRQEHFKVKPTYRSAAVLYVGAEGRSYVTTTLLSPLGHPIIHKIARVSPLSGGTPILIFTDETGLTVIEGLNVGDYRIEVPGETVLEAKFSVPGGTQSKISLGFIRFSVKEK